MNDQGNMIPGAPLEAERETETRIFCVFHNIKTGKYRLTQGDKVFVDILVGNGTFEDVIKKMISSYENVSKRKFKMG